MVKTTMAARILGAALVAALSASWLIPQARGQDVPEELPRPERDPLYAKKVKLDPTLRSYKPMVVVSGQIRGAHQDPTSWIVKAWAEGFQKIHPNVHLALNYASAFQSIPDLHPGAAEFAAAGRELVDPDRIAFRRKHEVGYDPLKIAVAGGSHRTMGFSDAVVFFVSKANPIDKLSLAQLDAMYSTTRHRGYKKDIRTWGQLGLTGEWADKPIRLWSITPPNGHEGFLRERVLKDGRLKDGIETRDTLFPLPYLVGLSRYAIGFSGFSHLSCGNNVKPIAVAENDEGPYYSGTFDEVLTRSYPLSRLIYIYVHRVPGKSLDPKLKEFIRYVLSREGQQVVIDDGIFLPLPAGLAEQELVKLD